MKRWKLAVAALITLVAVSCDNTNEPDTVKRAFVEQVTVNGAKVSNNGTIQNIPTDSIEIYIRFTEAIDQQLPAEELLYLSSSVGQAFEVLSQEDTHVLKLKVTTRLNDFSVYKLYINPGKFNNVELKDPFECTIATQLDPTPKFPIISDDSLMSLVQQQTFKFFFDYAHPVSGLTRERLNSGETVTTGGSGFGIAAIPVAIERCFITRQEGFNHLKKIVDFLSSPETEKFHGAFSHWVNGSTGKAIAFSTKDNGADLVETAFLIEGLLVAQSYFKDGNAEEQAVCADIQALYEAVEWTWFQKNGEQKLFWHWSPNYGWDMNMAVSGWNESLMVYVLAASSPTYPITKEVYDNGWARHGQMKNGNTYYGTTLPLGEAYGGPLFFSHYSFVGLDPRNLSDAYANYWEQNVAHATINYSYCVANPKNYYGYGENCWGLTASDVDFGYTASSPTHDVGCIAPTAALASMPYTPAQSTEAMKFFYYTLGDKLWGEYGFKDAFNLSKRWFASSYLAIDQGPIVVMIENHRTGLCWDLFMQNSDIRNGLTRLGFTY